MPFVASVAGRRIPVSRLEAHLARRRRGPRARHLPPDGVAETARLRRWLVQELVTLEVLAHEAGLAAPGSELPASAVQRLFERVTADITLPESDLRAYYERNFDLYRRPERRCIRHLVVATQRDAAEVARSLRDGRSDLSANAGHDSVQEVRRGDLSGDLEDALWLASPGDVIGPVRTEHGWHVALLLSVQEAVVRPFEEVRAEIEEELLADRRARVFREWLDGRRRAVALIEPAYEHPGHPIHGLPHHRH